MDFDKECKEMHERHDRWAAQAARTTMVMFGCAVSIFGAVFVAVLFGCLLVLRHFALI